RRQPKPEEVTKPWTGPVRGDAFVEGGSYLYYFTFGNLRILHQSTGNFIEKNLKTYNPMSQCWPRTVITTGPTR
ncbi:MAG TPA: hypothetical protein VHV54_09785, partial [Candidatus Binatia bacterium]|nr:hypothetical protein [Candidatus Binatia bacterium]